MKTTILWCGRNRFRSRAPALAILARLDAVALVLDTYPAGRMSTTVRAAPDDCVFSIGSSEAVGMVDVGCPVTTPLVKVSEGCWLDGEAGGGHWWLCVLCIVYQIRRVLPTSRPSRQCRSVHPSSGHHRGSSARSCTLGQG